MLSEDLKEQVYFLSDEDRAELRSLIMPRGVGFMANRGQQLIEVMEGILGERLPVKCRDTKYVWARSMIAYQLMQEGFTSSKAGRVLEKDHATVLHMVIKMKEALQFPQMYWDIMPLWNEFQNKLNDETNRKSIQDLITI